MGGREGVCFRDLREGSTGWRAASGGKTGLRLLFPGSEVRMATILFDREKP